VKLLVRFVGWILSAAAGAISLISLWFGAMTMLWMGIVPLFEFALGFWFIPIFVHELGHALAARSVGWRIWMFHVTPLKLRLQPLRLTFGASGEPGILGLVVATPSDIKFDTRLHSSIFTICGPIASWVLAAIGLAQLAPSS